MQIFNNKGGCVIIARLGRWLNDSASVIDESQLPSASHSAAYHPDQDTRRTSFGHIDDNDYPFYSDGTRAYFCITDVKETAEGISFSFSTDITGSSAVTEIDADLIPDGKIYTLQGIRINRITSTGIYIIDGKKVFVRK